MPKNIQRTHKVKEIYIQNIDNGNRADLYLKLTGGKWINAYTSTVEKISLEDGIVTIRTRNNVYRGLLLNPSILREKEYEYEQIK